MNRRWRLVAEFGPAVLFTILSQLEIWVGPFPLVGGGTTSGPKLSLTTFVGIISVGLALRLRRPLLALVLTMGPMALHWPIEHLIGRAGGPNLFEVFLAEVFIVYSTAAHTSGRRTLVAAGLVATIQLLAYGPYLPSALSQSFGEWVFYSIAWALGKTVLQRERRGDRWAERAAELARAGHETSHAAGAGATSGVSHAPHLAALVIPACECIA